MTVAASLTGLDAFKRRVEVSVGDITRDFLTENRQRIKVKKESVALRNLVTIIETTLRLGIETGFQAMSLRDLGRETGLSMGALYTYFDGKDDLLRIIQSQGQRTVQRILRTELEEIGEPRERLHAVIRTHLYLSELMPQWFYFFFMETKNLRRQDRRIPIESELYTEGVIVGIIEEGVARGVFRAVDAPLAGAAVKALLQDWYLKRWKYTARSVSVDDYCAFVIDFIESYIKTAGR